MLLRAALIASAFSAFILAADPPAAPTFSGKAFPDQDKSVTQLTQQALDKQMRAVVTGKPQKESPNPTRMPYRGFVLPGEKVKLLNGMWQVAQAFPPIGPIIIQAQVFCAVPLLEAKAPAVTDPMAKPTGNAEFDQIGKISAVPACKNWN